jgi:hypothetical protein
MEDSEPQLSFSRYPIITSDALIVLASKDKYDLRRPPFESPTMKKETAAIGLIGILALAILFVFWQESAVQNTPLPIDELRGGWAAYVVNARGGNIAAFVNATWKVPMIECHPNEKSAVVVWVGLGGVTEGSIEQIGTRNDCVNGVTSSAAWYELYPQQKNTVILAGFKVNPGERVSASVSYSNSTKYFQFLIEDGNETWFYSTSYANSSVSSAEWAVEAPAYANGTRFSMSNFSSITFSRGFAKIGNHTSTIAGFAGKQFSSLLRLTFVCGNGTQAQAGPITNGGRDFEVTRLRGSCTALALRAIGLVQAPMILSSVGLSATTVMSLLTPSRDGVRSAGVAQLGLLRRARPVWRNS